MLGRGPTNKALSDRCSKAAIHRFPRTIDRSSLFRGSNHDVLIASHGGHGTRVNRPSRGQKINGMRNYSVS